MKRNIFLVFIALIFILSIITSGVIISYSDVLAKNPSKLRAQEVDQSVIDEIVNAISQKIIDSETTAPVALLTTTAIENVSISTDHQWSKALLIPQDPRTDEPLPSEPGLAIIRYEQDKWQVYLPTEDGWLEMLENAPPDLISDLQKDTYREIYNTSQTDVPDAPLNGYLLPWAGGVTRNLTQSIFHDRYTPSGSAHYSFDFSSSGTLWDIYASKSGTVWLWYDSVETCYLPTCNETQGVGNYIVLQDTTTSPVSYQLYLHLAKDSIPAELKQQGAPVMQGQFIGITDNTGQSWGHHLHFQVHTNPYSYWGWSVDILFQDVAVNSGRPRLPAEATAYPEMGSQGQVAYTSQNHVTNDPFPPTGGLLEPMHSGFDIKDGIITLSAWTNDQGSGVAHASFMANYENEWHEIGPRFNDALHEYEWNLCADSVPVGPVTLALKVVDFANNQTSQTNSLTHGVNNSQCSPPPTCSPTHNQIAVFSEVDFMGKCDLLSIGDFNNSEALLNVGDDNAASVKIGQDVVATLYSGSEYTGKSYTVVTNDASLSDNVIGVNTLSSLKVTYRNQAALIPTPTWPTNTAEFTSDDTFYLVWSNNGGSTRFDVEISSDAEYFIESTDLPYLSVRNLPPGEYTWRVRAYNINHIPTSWSSLSHFSITLFPTPIDSYTANYTTSFDPLDPGWVWNTSWEASSNPEKIRSYPRGFVFSAEGSSIPISGSLTSPEISVPSTGYGLSFFYRFQGDPNNSHWSHRVIQISKNGSPFETVHQLLNDQPGIWLSSAVIPLDNYAGSKIRVRFHAESLNELQNEPFTWEIDDFSISEVSENSCADPSEPDNSANLARLINTDVMVEGKICKAGDIDWFKFEIDQQDISMNGYELLFDIDAQSIDSLLDPYLTLFDTDGKSILAFSDDEIPYERIDPRLGYRFTRPGIYYLLVKAWDHPQAGGDEYIYKITLSKGSMVTFDYPQTNGLIKDIDLQAQVLAHDSGNLVDHVTFYIHDNNWIDGEWLMIGEDFDGTDGWKISYDISTLPDQKNMAVYAQTFTRDGFSSAAASWDLELNLGRTIFLPGISK